MVKCFLPAILAATQASCAGAVTGHDVGQPGEDNTVAERAEAHIDAASPTSPPSGGLFSRLPSADTSSWALEVRCCLLWSAVRQFLPSSRRQAHNINPAAAAAIRVALRR